MKIKINTSRYSLLAFSTTICIDYPWSQDPLLTLNTDSTEYIQKLKKAIYLIWLETYDWGKIVKVHKYSTKWLDEKQREEYEKYINKARPYIISWLKQIYWDDIKVNLPTR